jgi:hypothetical protein
MRWVIAVVRWAMEPSRRWRRDEMVLFMMLWVCWRFFLWPGGILDGFILESLMSMIRYEWKIGR